MTTTTVEKLRASYVAANSKSHQAFERACKSLPGGSTRTSIFYEPFPLVMKSGHGCYLNSLDGVEYLDLVGEFSAGIFGHSHPQIVKAIQAAASSGINLGGPGEHEVELAERLLARFRSMDMIRFCNSGTEANTLALALATHYTKRSKILVFRKGYHGGTLTFADEKCPLNLPHEFVFGDFNDIASTEQVLRPDIGAILVEPMLGSGGLIPASREFLQFLRTAADRIGAVLVFDEVITSRLHINGFQGYYGIYPDMTTLGKYLGGGFSFGAFAGKRDIMRSLDARVSPADGGLPHSGTYNNNVFSMKAGIAACDLVTETAISELNALGDKLRTGIQEILDSNYLKAISTAGFGSLVGVKFTGPSAGVLGEILFFHMLEQGIYMGRRGFMNLSLVHDEGHISRVLEAFQGFAVIIPPGSASAHESGAADGHAVVKNGL